MPRFGLTLRPPHKHSFFGFIWESAHLDGYLLLTLGWLIGIGLFILYSASSQNGLIFEQQLGHVAAAFVILFFFAQISPMHYQRHAKWIYGISLIALIAVLLMGHTGKGAERWLGVGIFRFQPSELMKLALPIMVAGYCHKKQLPLPLSSTLIAGLFMFIPALLVAKQPDLSTAILLMIAGGSVLILAGFSLRLFFSLISLAVLCMPLIWYLLHSYQRQRILTFLNPERDPLGAGYHIIQSKIAIGSGGLFGKGWLNGTQSHLHFLPEHTTDFIFAVCGEEWGFLGSMLLVLLFMLVIFRGLYITVHAQDTFSRLLAGSLTFTFFFSFFINMGMVTGILPVMGIPLPLMSYGGSSMMTFMASFGILMSIQTHRKLLTS